MRSRRALAVATSAALGIAALSRGSHAQSPPSIDHLSDIHVVALAPQVDSATDVTLTMTGQPKFSARMSEAGRRLIIDLRDADVTQAPEALDHRVGLVAGILTQPYRDAGGPRVRIAMTMTHAASYRIRPEPGALHVLLSPLSEESGEGSGAPAPPRARAAPAPVGPSRPRSAEAASTSAAPELRDIRFVASTRADRLVLEFSGPPTYATRELPGGPAVLEFSDVALPRRLERTLDVAGAARYLRSVAVRNRGGKVVVEAVLGTEVPAHIERRGATLAWIFGEGENADARSGPSSETGIAPDGGAARRTRVVAREAPVLDAPVIQTSWHEGERPPSDSVTRDTRGLTAGRVDDGAPVESETVPSEAGAFFGNGNQQRYTGRRINLDLKDADIHNVLRLLADVGHVNVVTADNVTGTITIRMTNVPWDQALDVVLQAKGLGLVRQGNMLRVAPLADLEKEREMAIARRKQELELAPVETRLIPVSYAQATEIQQRARDMLSPRGSIAVDERTNVLIARDVPGNLNQVEELVRSLDTQTPQVLVEARIVEATSRYLRDVGIQWGGDATFSQATGNPTGLAFPSTVSVVGGANDAQTPTSGLSAAQNQIANPNFAVNLPATVGTGQGGALGLTLGAINNSVNIGIRLSAAEASGMVRIISSPRVLTMDNREARISQGTLIPFAQVSAQGVQTTFQEAKLQLLVRPHVTADGSVAMHVKVNRDEPDFTQTSPRGDPTILKREAETDLLVMDGHTAVIGGIYTRNTGRNLDEVPFFGDIPLIGLLFQRRRASDTRGELVIFLTPRIVNRAEALGR